VVWIKWCIIVFAGTEYKGHFTWVVKWWNMRGKIGKTHHFTSLYQLWKNQNTPHFLQLWYIME
jgi:hypothetical protein